MVAVAQRYREFVGHLRPSARPKCEADVVVGLALAAVRAGLGGDEGEVGLVAEGPRSPRRSSRGPRES
jgi:hypothetical protein